MKKSISVLLTSVAATWVISPALAQSADASAADEIIVTAQKRSENVQDIPVAVSAVSAQQLAKLGISNASDLGAAVPNLNVQDSNGRTFFYLRGVGNSFLGLGTENNVAYHVNGVYIARPRAQVGSFFDVDHIEVVRGPQGDLYGRNATGGSINVITKQPTAKTSIDASMTVGNYGLMRGEIGVGGTVVPDFLTARAAGYIISREGFGKNEYTGKDVNSRDEQAARLSLAFQLSPSFSYDVVADYFHGNDSSTAVHNNGRGIPDVPTLAEATGTVPSSIRNIVSGLNPERNVDVWGVQGTGSLDISGSASIKNVTAYRESKVNILDDLTGNVPVLQRSTQFEKQHQFSNELQFLANGDNWDLIVGAYYFFERVDGISRITIFGGPASFDQRGYQDTKSRFRNSC